MLRAAVQDNAESIEDRVVPGVSARFLSAVAWMLAVRPGERPQSAEALRSALDGRSDLPMRARSSGSGQTTIPAEFLNAGSFKSYNVADRVLSSVIATPEGTQRLLLLLQHV